MVADDCLHLGLRYTCISDFQVSPDSVKLVLGSGDNCLHCFVENVFEKKFPKFHLNRPSFMNVRLKTFLVCFFCLVFVFFGVPHSVYKNFIADKQDNTQSYRDC